jgi:hypothetical protein
MRSTIVIRDVRLREVRPAPAQLSNRYRSAVYIGAVPLFGGLDEVAQLLNERPLPPAGCDLDDDGVEPSASPSAWLCTRCLDPTSRSPWNDLPRPLERCSERDSRHVVETFGCWPKRWRIEP